MSKTEAALQALRAAIDARQPKLPAVRRNAPLNDLLDALDEALTGAPAATTQGALALVDGQGEVLDVALGDGEGKYSIKHSAEVQWLVAGPEGDDLDRHFDAGLEEIADAVAEDPTLGGVVNDARIEEAPERDLDVLGRAKPYKSAVLRVALLFTSPKPF